MTFIDRGKGYVEARLCYEVPGLNALRRWLSAGVLRGANLFASFVGCWGSCPLCTWLGSIDGLRGGYPLSHLSGAFLRGAPRRLVVEKEMSRLFRRRWDLFLSCGASFRLSLTQTLNKYYSEHPELTEADKLAINRHAQDFCMTMLDTIIALS